MNFDRTFESSFIGPSTMVDGVFSGSTNSTTLSYINNLYVNQYYTNEEGNVSGIGYIMKSDFMTEFTPQGWYMSGVVSILEKVKITPIDPNPICYKNKISIHATEGHPSAAYRWTYKALGSGEAEKPLLGNFATQNV